MDSGFVISGVCLLLAFICWVISTLLGGCGSSNYEEYKTPKYESHTYNSLKKYEVTYMLKGYGLSSKIVLAKHYAELMAIMKADPTCTQFMQAREVR